MDKDDKRLAWQGAFETRACPSEAMLFGEMDPLLQAHAEFCLICQEKLHADPEEIAVWRELGQQLAPLALPAVTPLPAPGQVWSISRKLNGWGPSNLYYNAPLVLLLAKIEGSASGFRVAQLSCYADLMGPDDSWLSQRFGFAELWHPYPLHGRHLESCFGELQPGALKKVLAQLAELETREYSPQERGAEGPEGSILYQFRSLESGVGSYFALQSLHDLMVEFEEASAAAEVMRNTQGWCFRTLPPLQEEGAADNYPALDNLLYALGTAEPPEGYPMLKAAQGVGVPPITVNCWDQGTHSPEGPLSRVLVHFSELIFDERGLVILGKFDKEPPGTLYAWLTTGDGKKASMPIPLDDEGEFKIVFPEVTDTVAGDLMERLVLLCVRR
jgi:hypothetical protein